VRGARQAGGFLIVMADGGQSDQHHPPALVKKGGRAILLGFFSWARGAGPPFGPAAAAVKKTKRVAMGRTRFLMYRHSETHEASMPSPPADVVVRND
jgi:hypothetical protein